MGVACTEPIERANDNDVLVRDWKTDDGHAVDYPTEAIHSLLIHFLKINLGKRYLLFQLSFIRQIASASPSYSVAAVVEPR